MNAAYDWSQFVPTVAAILIAALGWVVVHRQNLRREVAAEKRKIRITFLLEAYRKLERVCHFSGDDQRDYKVWLETALADIQLLGTRKQDGLAKDFARAFTQNGTAQLDELLDDLRQSLRYELELEPITEKMLHTRIMFDNKVLKKVMKR